MIFIVVLCVLSLDQATKALAEKYLTLNQSLPLIKGVFHLTLVHNRGAAFGIFRNQIPLFIAVSLVAIFLISLSLKEKKSKAYKIALSLILGGAIGNLIDRAFLGYVVDFLDFRIWPIFNIADSVITVGAVLIGYFMLFSKDRSRNSEF